MTTWIRPGEDAAWEALFTGFRRSAFRFEAQQVYRSDVEDAAVERFRAGRPHGIDLSWMTAKLRQHRAAGRSQTLVRVVVEPPTDYTAMELLTYPEFDAAGQDTHVVATTADRWPDGLPHHDFWIFDGRGVWRMHYTDDHRWSGAELLDHEDAVRDHLQWRDAALAQAVALDVYLASRTDRSQILG